MGGIYICRRDADGAVPAADLEVARQQYRHHGFAAPTAFETPTHIGFHTGFIHGGPDGFFRRGSDFVAVAGTLVYDGKMGTPALAALLDAFSLPFSDWDRLAGQFALLVHKNGRTLVMTDYFGAFQLFRTPDDRVLTTSFLTAAQSCPRLHLADQGVYEFAFNVFPTGNDTVFREIARLGPDTQLELGHTTTAHAVKKPLPAAMAPAMPLAERVDRQAALLRNVTAPYIKAWGDKVQCPLSGGLDSRLALALLRDSGVKPHVYVYGKHGDTDADIAEGIADGEGFALELFAKPDYAQITPDDFAAIVDRNFHETDALVTDGGLFDNGGNAYARHARQIGGQLAVSGGCGEVFRNFFYLPDRRLSARDVVRAFFARFAPSDTTARFQPETFIGALEAKALEALGLPDAHGPLDRVLIEQLYPRMRCRAFFGREISLVGRHGGYLMPFLDHKVIAEALSLPIALKNLGLFEAALMTRIDPKLASYPSAYGHSFDQPPTLGHIISEYSTRIRPTWVRQHSYALRRRLGSVDDDHGGLLTPAYLGRVLDLHFPFMRDFFNVRAVKDRGLYRRIATLELLAQKLADRIAAD